MLIVVSLYSDVIIAQSIEQHQIHCLGTTIDTTVYHKKKPNNLILSEHLEMRASVLAKEMKNWGGQLQI